MAKFCSTCGTALSGDYSFCPKCGARLNTVTPPKAPEVQPKILKTEPPKNPKKLKWWMIAIPAVLIFALVITLLWTPLALLFAPKAVLSSAMVKTSDMLAHRSQGSPLLLLAKPYATSEYTMEMDLLYSDDYSSEISLNLSVQNDLKKQQSMAIAEFSAEGESFDFSLYLDQEAMAFGSDRLTNNAYYGITYKTFADDFRDSELYEFLCDNMDSSEIEAVDQAIDVIANSFQNAFRDTVFSEEYAVILNEFVDGLEPVVGSTALMIGSEMRNCDTFTFTLTEEGLVPLLQNLLTAMENDEALKNLILSSNQYSAIGSAEDLWDDMIDSYEEAINILKSNSDFEIIVSYCTYKNYVAAIQIQFSGEIAGESCDYNFDINFGENPAEDDIVISAVMYVAGEEFEVEAVLSTNKDETIYDESLSIGVSTGYDSLGLCVAYQWDKTSGDFLLTFEADENGNSEELGITAELEEIDGGFTFSFDDFSELLGDDSVDSSIVITVTEGCDIEKPNFKNADAWTSDDLYDLVIEIEDLYY